MKKKAVDIIELPKTIQHNADVRRYKEMCSVALTALSYIDLDRVSAEQGQQYASIVNELRRLKMEFEYS